MGVWIGGKKPMPLSFLIPYRKSALGYLGVVGK